MKAKFLIPFLLLLMACDTEDSTEANAFASSGYLANANISSPEDFDEYTQKENSSETNPKLIISGNLEFETSDLTTTLTMVKDAVLKYDGYISRENEVQSDLKIESIMVVKVPSDRFNELLESVSTGVKHFDRKVINTTDISEEYFDIQARLEAKKKVEKRYLEILNKAGTIKEILEVESQAGQIREEIESLQGRINYFNNRVAYSSLEIICYQATPISNLSQTNFISQLKAGLSNGVDIVKSLILGLVNIWPLTLLGVAGFFFFKQRIRTKQLIEPSE